MGFLERVNPLLKNWGELTHKNDSWDEPPSSYTGWGPKDSFQLRYKWTNSMVYSV